MRFVNASTGIYIADVCNPFTGYTVECDMALEGVTLSSGAINYRDYGSQYDNWSCKGEFIYTDDQKSDVNNLFGNNDFKIQDFAGFYPLTESVSIPLPISVKSDIEYTGWENDIGKEYKAKFEFFIPIPDGINFADPVSQPSFGSVSIAGVNGLRYPDGLFGWDNVQNTFVEPIKGSNINTYDYGTQKEGTDIDIILDSAGCINLVQKLVRDVRGGAFSVSGSGIMQNEDASYTVKLSDSRLRFKHINHNRWSMKIKVIEV